MSNVASAGELLELIRTGRTATRRELGRVTGLSRTAVSGRLAALFEAGLLTEGDDAPSSGGRPAATLRFDHDAGVVVAIAVGRSRSQVAVTDLRGVVLGQVEEEQEIGAGPDVVMPRLAAHARELVKTAGRPLDQVWAVGVTVPGTVDREAGMSRDSPVLRGWDGVPLRPFFADFAPRPVVFDNDANALALSERDSLLRSCHDLIVLKASTGLGAGLVMDGRLVRGAWGAAGEIGHVKSASAVTEVCRCGESGCLESVAGGWVLVQAMRDAGYVVDHIRAVAELAEAGDATARRLVREAGRRVGEVLASAVNLLNPQAVVVAGDLAAAFDPFVAGLREGLYVNASAVATRNLEVLPATHGAQAGVVGCAHVALDAVLGPAAVDARLAAT